MALSVHSCLLWYRFYYAHQLIDSVSPVYGIFLRIRFFQSFLSVIYVRFDQNAGAVFKTNCPILERTASSLAGLYLRLSGVEGTREQRTEMEN